MPSSIDDRIVAMSFDNQRFEERIAATIASLDRLQRSLDFSNAQKNFAASSAATIASLDKLHTSLNFTDSKKGFADIAAAANRVNLAGIGAAVDSISSKFSAMGAIAFTVLQNVVNKAIDAGAQIASSLSLNLVIDGFKEYETNMNSIQTIMSNTRADATTLQDVNKALDQLNEYSDQTIYNFGEMARNIGTFTAAGIDLDTSVEGIKGIANLAAISGSNSQQASTAMYQLSQALASGSVKLMDWNSIVNAGMGGEVFQKALFETGKALGTIADTPIDTTFEAWKEAGNTFRGSLEEGWITAEVLTNTLSGFTGDLTEAQILAMGYTQDQVAAIMEMGQVGKDAATKVKTLTQLISTVKESIGSGWSASFRLIFGDFEEASRLFTNINNTLGKFIGTSADARNEILKTWHDFGGRDALIEALTNAFDGLMSILRPIRDAFQDIFPPMTAERLLILTDRFRTFTEGLKLVPAQVVAVRNIFKGVFSAFRIGIEVVKEIFGVFGNIFNLFQAAGPSEGFLKWAGGIGKAVTELKERLVDGGEIADFFGIVNHVIEAFVKGASGEFIQTGRKLAETANKIGLAFRDIKDKIVEFLSGGIENAGDVIEEIGEKLDIVGRIGRKLGDVWDFIKAGLARLMDVFGAFGSFVLDALGDLPQQLANIFGTADYSQALDAVNTGLFAGLVLLFRSFLTDFELGTSGVFSNLADALGELTGVLSAMQTNIKADAILKIAIALGVLVAAMVVLSFLDAGALTRSLAAMAGGLGELIGMIAFLTLITTGPMGAAKLALLTGSLILLSIAVLLLSVAMQNLSGLDWEEIAKGLTAVGGLLAMLTLAVGPLTENSAGMIRAGLGLIVIGIGLNILALAVKSFAEMEWEAMGQGLTGVFAGLTAIGVAVSAMPDNLVLTGVGLIAISIALNILALALKSFAEMEWSELGKGMAAMAVALLILAGAMYLLPNGALLALQGAGLLMIGIGLVEIAKAIQMLGGMSWEDMIRGVAGIAGVLLVLAGAAFIMQGALPGAAAILIMALALKMLAGGIKAFAGIPWADLLKGLSGVLLMLGTLALGAIAIQAAIPAILGLGAALLLVGAGFALFGYGAVLVATAFSIIATAGTQGVATLAGAIAVLVDALPEVIGAFGAGLITLVQMIVDALPAIIAGLDDVIAALLDLFIANIPKLGETVLLFLLEIINVIEGAAPELIGLGLSLLLDLLKGIRDNIGEVVTTAIQIITEFLTAIAEQIPTIIAAGLAILVSLLEGIAQDIGTVITAAATIISEFIKGVGAGAQDVIEAGGKMIADIITGLGSAAEDIIEAGAKAVASFISGIDDNFQLVIDAGWDMIIDLVNGVAASVEDNMPELRDAGIRLAGAIVDGMTGGLASKLGGVIDGVKNMGGGIIGGLRGLVGANSPATEFIDIGHDIVDGLAIGLSDNTAEDSANTLGNRVVANLQNTLSKIPYLLENMEEFTPTITPVLDLTQVEAEARKLSSIMGVTPMIARASFEQAEIVATTSARPQEEVLTDSREEKPTEIKFEQHNYSPEALSTADIYRQTRNLITISKEELKVL